MILRWAFCVDSVPFTRAVRDGQTSLGGSESACLGLARALAARGQAVHVFATQLAEDAEGPDAWGVFWHRSEDVVTYSNLFHWDVFVGLRMPKVFNRPIRARFRILWNQDLMNVEEFKVMVMAVAWNLDALAYVSDYHRRQWEGVIPELAGLGYVTRNGFDPAHVPAEATKDPNRIIHISRPERGLGPLLQMWPAFKQAHPNAVLQVCRYSSMYDATGWGQVCAAYDAEVARINAEVGGIEYLGELNKAQLYKAIAEAAVMWYPGVSDFAETSCIAAIEAQACGTPFVGSWKGALPETVPGGALITGDAFTPEYQAESIRAVSVLLEHCGRQSRAYRELQGAGRRHVEAYTYAAIAEEWEAFVLDRFRARYEANTVGVLRQLIHEDDLMTAQVVAREILERGTPEAAEAAEALALIDRVAGGETHTAENYATHSMDTDAEIAYGGRIPIVTEQFADCAHVLDVACGNGAYAVSLALKYPDLRVTAVDFAPGNIAKGRAAAERAGVADRITFVCAPVWDFLTQGPSAWLAHEIAGGPRFDGLWIGEFIEHVAHCSAFIDTIEQVCTPGAKVVYTCPSGPLTESLPRNIPLARSHVHHFTHDDLLAVWGGKLGVEFQYLNGETSPLGSVIGGWLITYRVSDAPAGQRPHRERALKTRPRLRLSVGVLAYNAEHDLGRCLDSVWFLADEILVANTGSTDGTRQVAETFGRKVRVIDLPAVADHAEGFAGARNAVLAQATGDWFLWMDTDEVLVGSSAIRAYVETGGPFLGFALKQNHFQLDAPFHFDTPVRIFRTGADIRFYGCVHEQPQLGDCNGDIHPALQLEEAQIAHFGYLVAGIRKRKAYQRNRPLLLRDLEVFPDRRLGKVIWLRQLQQDADELALTRGDDDPAVKRLRQKAVRLFQTEFADPGDKYHPIGRPFYEGALQGLGEGFEIEMACAGKRGGLGRERAKPTRFWVQDGDEIARLLDFQKAQVLKGMTPAPVRVDPFVEAPKPVEAATI